MVAGCPIFIYPKPTRCRVINFSRIDGIALKKKEAADEFLVEKKNPLVQPPRFGQLPVPGEKSSNNESSTNNIEKIFKVNVTKINIINKQNRTKFTRGRKVKVSGFKKAIITLKKGQSIDLTTGI